MKTDDERKLLVLARTHREFLFFCGQHDLNPRSRDVKYIDSPDRLRGYRDDWIVVLDEPADLGYLEHLIDVGSLIQVPYEEPPAPTRFTFPEIRVRRGGIRFPVPARRELEGEWL